MMPMVTKLSPKPKNEAHSRPGALPKVAARDVGNGDLQHQQRYRNCEHSVDERLQPPGVVVTGLVSHS